MSLDGVEEARGVHEALRRRDLRAFLGYIDAEVQFTPLVLEAAGRGTGSGIVLRGDAWQEALEAAAPPA